MGWVRFDPINVTKPRRLPNEDENVDEEMKSDDIEVVPEKVL